MKRITLCAAALLTCLSLYGCNTARGFGADLEVLGGALKNAGKKEQTTSEPATTESVPATYNVEEGAYTQPYQDPSYAPVSDVPAATTYPVEQEQTYPEYK